MGWHSIQARPDYQWRGSIDTHQSDWELHELIKIYEEVAPQRILEIGSFRGGTLYQWLTNAKAGATVVNIDNFCMIDWMTDKRYINDFLMEWQDWKPPGVWLETIVDDSRKPEVVTRVMEILYGNIDFMFIDADHSYEAVFDDFNNYGQYVRKGGVIALHDIKQQDNRPGYGVWKLWKEIKEAGYVTRELKVIADGKGIGVVYV